MAGQAAPLQPQHARNRVELVGPSHIEFKHKELLNKVSGHGLQLGYRFTRSPHLYSSSMCSIELQFQNRGEKEITAIHLGQTTLPAGMQLNEFAPVTILQPQQTASGVLGVDFNDSTHAVDLELISSAGSSRAACPQSGGAGGSLAHRVQAQGASQQGQWAWVAVGLPLHPLTASLLFEHVLH